MLKKALQVLDTISVEGYIDEGIKTTDIEDHLDRERCQVIARSLLCKEMVNNIRRVLTPEIPWY